MFKKFLAAAGTAVVVLGLGGVLAAGSTANAASANSHSSVSYADTALYATDTFGSDHYFDGNPNLSGSTLTDTLGQMTVTNAPSGVNPTSSDSGTIITFVVTGSPTGAITLSDVDHDGAVAVLTIPVNSGVLGGLIVDKITDLDFTAVNSPYVGGQFTASGTHTVTYSASNLPAGLVNGVNLTAGGSLTPVDGSAVPGTYDDVTVTATDVAGATATKTFDLTVDANTVRNVQSAAGAISNENSAKCLDNSNYNWVGGNPLQQWTCGAAGGVDQSFQLATVNGQTVLEALDYSHATDTTAWCVTTDGFAKPLVIEVCSGDTDQVVSRHGSFYEFPGTGYVMDVKGASKSNGAPVIGYPKKSTGTANQMWSLP